MERHRDILALLHGIKRNDAEFALASAGNKKKRFKNGVEDQKGSEGSSSSGAPSEADATETSTGKPTAFRISAWAEHVEETEEFTLLSPAITGPEDKEKSVGEMPWKERSTPMTRKERKKARKSAAHASRILETELITAANLEFVSGAIYIKTNKEKGANMNADEENGQASKKPCPEPEDIGGDQGKSKLGGYGQRVQNTMGKPRTPRKELREVTRLGKITKFSRKDSQRSPFVASDPFHGIDPQIFERLGVQVIDVPHGSKKRQDLIKKLAIVIQEDLDAMDREERDAKIREEAFWRFVSKDAKVALTELHKQFSWATGELKKNKSQKMEPVPAEDPPVAPQGLDVSLVNDVGPVNWTTEIVHETERLVQRLRHELGLVRCTKTHKTQADLSSWRTCLEEFKEDLLNLMMKRAASQSLTHSRLQFLDEYNELKEHLVSCPGRFEDIISREIEREEEILRQQENKRWEREEAHRQGKPCVKRIKVLRIVEAKTVKKTKQEE